MRRRSKKRGRGRFSRFVRLLILFFLTPGIGGLWIGYKVRTLGEVIEKKFNVARRWNIPSKVYSDTTYLYPDLPVGEDLKHRLQRLEYREVDAVRTPGDFYWGDEAVEIYLHDFDYPQEKFSGHPVRIELSGKRIRKITDLNSGEMLTVVRLEPEEVATLFDEKMEDRTLVTLKDCPAHLLEAVILIEDERFFEHRGIDPVAIVRALFADLLTLRLSQGASTITQQLVKNFFLTSEKSFSRKFNEMLMALIIENRYAKGEILEAYLNEIYLGQRGPSSVTGVGEAARFYFAKDIHQMTLAEAALLAGMIRSPNRYSPFLKMENAVARKNFVLTRMWEAGIIPEKADYLAAMQEPIVTPQVKIRPVFAPYFIDLVRHQLADLYSEEVLETEGLQIFTTLDMGLQKKAEGAVRGTLDQLEKDYAYLLPKEHPQGLQSCLIALTPQNGYVRAMVGGRSYGASQFNRCTQASRQPGSTFKPFVYLTAMDPSRSRKVFTPASLVEDVKFTTPTALGPWTPSNYDREEHGWVTVREALEKSYNISTARLAMEAGLEEIVETAQAAGITSYLSPVPSLALGAFEVSPIEMAAAYTIFPNLGMRSEPLAIIHVMTPDGRVLERKSLKMKKVVDPRPVALTNQMMKGVIDRGTAARVRGLGFQGVAAGKTGTTSNYRDAWFAGFTKDLLSLVWVGYDDNASMRLSGSKAALPVWTAFMKEAANGSREEFPFPSGLVEVEIDPKQGCVAPKSWNEKFREYFIQGTEPETVCQGQMRAGDF